MSKRTSLIAHGLCAGALNALVIGLNTLLWLSPDKVDTSVAAVITIFFLAFTALLTALIVVHATAIGLAPVATADHRGSDKVSAEHSGSQSIEVRMSIEDEASQQDPDRFIFGFLVGSVVTALAGVLLRRH